MIIDATTAQLCTRYPRGSAKDEADLFYLCLFHALRLLNADFRSFKSTRILLMQYLLSVGISQMSSKRMVDDIQYIIELSFITDKANRILSGIVETIEVDGIVYKVPIFALSKTTSLSPDGKPKMGVTIYDDISFIKTNEDIVKNSFLYNITLYALRQRCVSLDFVEYIYKVNRIDAGSMRHLPGHKRVVIADPTFDYSLIKSYNNIFKKNMPNVYHCESCKYKTKCWGANNHLDIDRKE